MPMMAALLLLHPVERIEWLRWSVHPSTVIGITLLGALYWWRCRTEGRLPTPGQRLSFAFGLVALFAALNGPIHDLSDYYLFSAHMVQHLVLTMLVTPLLLAGTPGWMLAPALRHPAVAAIARRLTTPAACFLIFNAILVAWHLPPLYNAAMASHDVHIAQHLFLLAGSTLMWWPLLSPLPELPRLSYPKQMLYTFLLTLPMATVSIAITYSDQVLYPAYAAAPRLLPLSPLEDQRLGGLIMWIPGGLIFLAVLTVVFFKWAAAESDDHRVQGAPAGLST
jgi:putative membrane protein